MPTRMLAIYFGCLWFQIHSRCTNGLIKDIRADLVTTKFRNAVKVDLLRFPIHNHSIILLLDGLLPRPVVTKIMSEYDLQMQGRGGRHLCLETSTWYLSIHKHETRIFSTKLLSCLLMPWSLTSPRHSLCEFQHAAFQCRKWCKPQFNFDVAQWNSRNKLIVFKC